MKYIDIGCNLMSRQFDKDRDQILQDAASEHVGPIIITGSNERSSAQAADYCKARPQKAYFTAGIHPHDSKNAGAKTIKAIEDLSKHDRCVAIGECGLDYDRDFSPRKTQREWFEKQLMLATGQDKPVFLHERSASNDFASILSDFNNLSKRSVVHCFTGSADELEKYLALGCYIGITGWVCDRVRGEGLRKIVKNIPLDRILIETDAPYLFPKDIKARANGGRNTPSMLPHIARSIATLRGESEEDFTNSAYENTIRFFSLKID